MSTFGDTFGKTWVPLGSLLNQPEAIAYIVASGITDATQKKAINDFVKDLKAINAVQENFVNFTTPANSILRACYPFVGGDLAKHKLNLIEPIDSDDAFRLTQTGTVVHDANGVTPNYNSNSFLDTHFKPASNFSNQDKNGIDIYINFSKLSANRSIGVQDASVSNSTYAIAPGYVPGYANYRSYGANLAPPSDKSKTKCTGFFQINATNTGVGGVKLYGNLQNQATNASEITIAQPNKNIQIGNITGGNACGDVISFVGIRNKDISDEVNALYYNAVIKLQKTLNRLSQKSIYPEGHSMMFATIPILLNLVHANFSTRIRDWYSPAVSGSNMYAGTNLNINNRYSTLKTAALNANVEKKILPLWIGINDIGVPKSGAQVFSDVLSYLNTAITDGFIPVVLTCTKTTTAGWATAINDYNTLLRSSLPEGCTLIDLDLHPEFSDPSNATYFADGLHMTTAAYTIVANDILAVINSL